MLSAANAMSYEATGTKESKKKDLNIISEMGSMKIVRFLAYRHRVGLLTLSNIALVSYIVYDKVHYFWS